MVAVFLNGVCAGFVEGIDERVVSADGLRIERTERDAGDLVEGHRVAVGAKHTDASANFVSAPSERLEHGERLLKVFGLAEWLAIEKYEGIGTDNETTGVRGGHAGGLESGIGLA